MHLINVLLNKIYSLCGAQANLNVWLIRSLILGMAGG